MIVVAFFEEMYNVIFSFFLQAYQSFPRHIVYYFFMICSCFEVLHCHKGLKLRFDFSKVLSILSTYRISAWKCVFYHFYGNLVAYLDY
jgi:hypothetical protein